VNRAKEAAVIYEYRKYVVNPGRLNALIERMNDHTAGFFDRHGIRLVGAWQAVVGNTNELHYILAWNDFAERQERWGAFSNDPEWLGVLGDTDANGKLREHCVNELWMPIACSPLQ
jgi:hypothetical protein